ncbi:MAG: 2-amino-4-hydroxy-6-hydroxymethyldihydropteridine diphosphokinase [Rhodospirillales bacterium]|jgi:2-amino-4-hydroxy-6-hydroxymethyldihydropteridine diphosphokinase|nr:2-amino-4-hydroxy-6-hydroxymethyldihydropteridine diphosphokinase [Rhodospirillales bacterium]
MQKGVFVGLGGNLASAPWGSPRAVLEAAVATLAGQQDIRLLRRSRWYRSPPQPPSAQPWFINGVLEVATHLPPGALLARLHAIEAGFGRVRRVRNEARILDLDLLAYGSLVSAAADSVQVPHPRLHERAFVLAPLCELAPAWQHPRLGRSAEQLLIALPGERVATPLDAGEAGG